MLSSSPYKFLRPLPPFHLSLSRSHTVLSFKRYIMMLFLVLHLLFLPLAFADLQVGFYNSTCPQAESLIRSVVLKHFNADRSITAALLRMHFHDCFVRGCDASILIDSEKKKPSEKAAGPNLTVRGYEIIDEAKAALESQCPSTISCADVLALATRDAVALAGGPNYVLPTGRRDGLVSNAQEVNLPGPSISVSQAVQVFARKGLTLRDMVTLLGAHTVGVAHCGFFRDRLFNFKGTGSPDPSMDSSLRNKLAGVCGMSSRGSNQDPTAFLDQNTSFVVDNQFYNQILNKRGVLQIDQELASNRTTSGVVASFRSDRAGFLQAFEKAMVKMANIEVLVGNSGEIRKSCRAFNKAKKGTSKDEKTKNRKKLREH